MASKRDLGVSYFLGLGLGLIVTLIGYFVLVDGVADLVSVGTLTAIGFAGSLPYLGYWLKRSDLSDNGVWEVAEWCAAGVGIPTVLVSGLMLLGIRPTIVVMFPHLIVNVIAAGALFGALLGLIRELRRQYDKVDALNRRNRILNRVMQHDIRNDVSVINAYLELIADQDDPVDEELLEPVLKKSDEIVETSEMARTIQSLESDVVTTPVDAVATIERCLDGLRGTHPDAEIRTDLPEEAWVEADELLSSVIDNVVENAIEHNDTTSEVRIGVETASRERIAISIADNGPGIPDEYRRTITTETEPPSPDTPGLGLWLVKWFVDSYGGSLHIDANEHRGTTVRIELPAAAPGHADATQPSTTSVALE